MIAYFLSTLGCAAGLVALVVALRVLLDAATAYHTAAMQRVRGQR